MKPPRPKSSVIALVSLAGLLSAEGPGPDGFVGTAEEIARRSGRAEIADTIRSFSK